MSENDIIKKTIIEEFIDVPTGELAHMLGVDYSIAETLQLHAVDGINKPAHPYELWSTGITMKAEIDEMGTMWMAVAEVQDQYFADGKAVSLELKSRYWREDIAEAIDNVLEVAKQIGVEWGSSAQDKPHIYYYGDGEDPDNLPPQGWKYALKEQCDRIGWKFPYETEEEQ